MYTSFRTSVGLYGLKQSVGTIIMVTCLTETTLFKHILFQYNTETTYT